jgi:hypothetical protein
MRQIGTLRGSKDKGFGTGGIYNRPRTASFRMADVALFSSAIFIDLG